MARPKLNNAIYFQHYTSMRNHRKVKALKTKFGALKGYAFWCMMLEWLTERDGLEWEYTKFECEMFAADLGVSAAEIREMVDYCLDIELLFKTDTNFIYSQSLNEYLNPLFEKRKKERERSAQRKRREEELQKNTSNHVSAAETAISDAETNQSAADIPHNRREYNRKEESSIKGDKSPTHPQEVIERFEAFQNWLSQKASSITRMKEPFTIDQFITLTNKFSIKTITDLCLKMHNWKPLLQKNTSAYLTLLNWSKKESIPLKNEQFKNNQSVAEARSKAILDTVG
jgi:hypothetical protein